MSLQTINVQKSLIWKKVLFSGNKMKNRLQFDKQCCAAMHSSESEPFWVNRPLLIWTNSTQPKLTCKYSKWLGALCTFSSQYWEVFQTRCQILPEKISSQALNFRPNRDPTTEKGPHGDPCGHSSFSWNRYQIRTFGYHIRDSELQWANF